jgi:RNA polymerase sigma-70 factor, ECF subfamily
MSEPEALSPILIAGLRASLGQGGAAPGEPPADLEEQLRGMLAGGRAAWPEVALPAPLFLRHLAERLPEAAPFRALPFVLVTDLYLACACVHGVPGALPAFEARFLSQVDNFLAHMTAERRDAGDLADEVRQALRERLLLSPAETAPKLAEYSGRGALLMWVRVAALRTALNLRRTEGRRRERPLEAEGQDLGAALPIGEDPELAYLKGRYATEVADAVRAATAALPPQQRVILRLYWVEGQGTDRIAAAFRVNRSTVTRWLAASREAILGETRRRLMERLQLSPAEFESLVRVVRSRIDVSLRTLLGDAE